MTSGWLQDGLALEGEQQHQRGQQRGNRPRADFFHGRVERRLPLGSSALRQSCARITGMTMYSTTEVSSVSHGTVMAEMPSSRPPAGQRPRP
jgi:hypothetical protein